ncbi:unconventional myosin IC-like [Amphibalanus amphitrite]|uniref:unconventional myosin IC-like n=1 Tax=Amphibalanus amphitrite TaxID=1232801 RepID=UPI001C929659|nr:unconventional myosin IC-like [Amphibalanus amphitrite]
MERALHARDQIGVEDFVLLEDYRSQEAFVDNLRKRFNADLIYTYIGPVLVSVNPYKELGIYGENHVKEYKGEAYYELPPHIYAVINGALTSLVEETRDQCILISGESGSGKTEASKKILQYIGEVCSRTGAEVRSVRDRLIQSNPVLEAFGNARTVRNDNSSRFGKYMDVEFNFMGEPTGGHIRNYLLEKSRVVSQAPGECNFHVFHLLLAGASDELLKELCLERDPKAFNYTKQSGHERDGMNDADQYHTVVNSMDIVGFGSGEQRDVQAIVAAILHLGNVHFQDVDGVSCSVDNAETTQRLAKVLGIPADSMQRALTHRTIEAQADVVTTTLGVEQSVYARDALSKAVYDRLFTWLVRRLNMSLASHDQGTRHSLLGILDIYGFEVFKSNSFEQFCINYCNEKLQQVFIELTLKSEQEEYLAEGIAWVPVEYFNNKIICDMIEMKHTGIVSLLDEECLRPGEANDMTFLNKMTQALRSHAHFVSHESADNKARKTIRRDEFRLKHYAGDVTYNVKTFMDKNNDLLYRDLKDAMAKSSNKIVQDIFPASELQGKKMPETVSTQFKKSLDQLMTILMSKEPSYVRCIKPNDVKQSHKLDTEVVSHQVKYLGLMENLRVRRAGFAFRRPFEPFLRRYKSLCPDTWPRYDGPARAGVHTLMKHLGFGDDDYSMGKTKVFIRLPKTIFEVEDRFQARKHELVTLITKIWRGRRQRLQYQKQRECAIVVQKYIRRHLAMKDAEKRRWAVSVVRRFVTGFITRNGPENDVNRRFVRVVRREWLKRLAGALPRSVLERTWPPAPPPCREADRLLRPLHLRWLTRRYVRHLPPDRKYALEQKVLAEKLFKGRKAGYPKTVAEPFRTSRLSAEHEPLRPAVLAAVTKVDSSEVKYVAPVTKYDRHGYKPRARWIVATKRGVYVLDVHDKPKLKDRFALENVQLTVTAESDQLLLLKKVAPDQNGKEKGDLILICPHVIELVTKLAEISAEKVPIEIVSESSLTHSMKGGKAGTIDLVRNPAAAIHKDKTAGHLVVTHG